MSISIIGIISLILGFIGLFMSGTIWGIVPCLIAIILGVIALTDYLAYKWPSICGLFFALLGLGLIVYMHIYPYYVLETVVNAIEESVEVENADIKNNEPQKMINSESIVVNQPVSLDNTAIEVKKKESASEENAIRKAKDYLSVLPFSREGLKRQLIEFDKFPEEDATYGVDNCGTDWNEQAIRKAKDYLELIGFSEQGLIGQMEEFDLFTNNEATYGVKNAGVDWYEQAARKAKEYLQVMSFSYDELVNQLVEYDLFTNEQATYGVNRAFE